MPLFKPTPLIRNSAGEPAKGIITVRVTNEFNNTAGDLITRATGQGTIEDGVLLNAAGNAPLFIPHTPDLLAVEIFMFIDEYGDGRRPKRVEHYAKIVPDVATVGWDELDEAVPADMTGSYVIPQYVQDILDSATASAASSAASASDSNTSALASAASASGAATSANTATQKAADVAAVVATNDGIMNTVAGTPSSAFATRLSATFAGLIQLAKNPDALVVGAVTGDPLTSAAVIWPNGTPGTLTITARHSTGAVNSYAITYGSPVTRTFTQPAITRATSGAATNVPQIVIS